FYERFAPQTPTGVADPAGGIREFVAGTGGALVTSFGTVRPNSQVRNSGTFGVLNLTLGDGSYSWQFVPVAGKTFTDSGTTACHSGRRRYRRLHEEPGFAHGEPDGYDPRYRVRGRRQRLPGRVEHGL